MSVRLLADITYGMFRPFPAFGYKLTAIEKEKQGARFGASGPTGSWFTENGSVSFILGAEVHVGTIGINMKVAGRFIVYVIPMLPKGRLQIFLLLRTKRGIDRLDLFYGTLNTLGLVQAGLYLLRQSGVVQDFLEFT